MRKWLIGLKRKGRIQLVSKHCFDIPPMKIMEMGSSGFSPTTYFYFYFRRWVPLWLATFVAKCFLTSTVQYIFTGFPATLPAAKPATQEEYESTRKVGSIHPYRPAVTRDEG